MVNLQKTPPAAWQGEFSADSLYLPLMSDL